jgi:hypothetical protein
VVNVKVVVIVLGLTLISGFGDAQGFVHAARVWQGGRLVWPELAKSAAGFAVGIASFWLSVRYMGQLGVVSPEIQALLWFSMAMIGVALASGRFLQWQRVDQMIGLLVLLGLGWLVFRTGG